MKDAGVPPKELEFTPPLGKSWLTPLYDGAIAFFTRESRWRRAPTRITAYSISGPVAATATAPITPNAA